MLLGTYKDGILIEAGGRGQFPLEWQQHTPFSDYTIPALILTIGVVVVHSSPQCCSSQAAKRASSRLW
jgi:hypothetical protein